MGDVTLVPLAVAPGSTDGSTPQAMATADNYICRNNGRVILHFIKEGANPATITIVTPKTLGGLALAEQTFVVQAAGGVEFAGPFDPDVYNDPSGDMDISTSEETDITVQALQI